MSLAPILAAGAAVQIHLVTVTAAFFIGTWMMVRPKGTAPHKALGRTYVALMVASAISTFWIRGIGHGAFSFLHLLSIFVLVALPVARSWHGAAKCLRIASPWSASMSAASGWRAFSPCCLAVCCSARCSVPERTRPC
jgi:uncharacterized membrane protein